MAFERMTQNVLNVSALPNAVTGQASSLKATFDAAGVSLKTFINALLDVLEANGAESIGADVSSVTTKTVQAILSAFEAEIANRYTKAEIDTLVAEDTNDLVADLDVNLTTGVITVTKKDGTVETFDTALEKVPATFEIVEADGSYALKITNVDGTTTQADITSFMNLYTFANSDYITFEVTGTGNEKTVTANIKANSIGLDKLSLSVVSTLEGYMTSARDSASAAKISENNAKTSADSAARSAEIAQQGLESGEIAIRKATEAESYAHGGTGTREGEDTDNAKYYSQVAKEVAGGDFVTPTEMKEYVKQETISFEETHLEGQEIETQLPLAMESVLSISGNSEQETRSGKNLFNINGDVNTRYNGTTSNKNSVENGILLATSNFSDEHGYGQRIYVGAGNTVTFSARFLGVNGNVTLATEGIAGISLYDDNTVAGFIGVRFENTENNTIKQLTKQALTDYIIVTFGIAKRAGVNEGTYTSASFTDIQVEIASTATPYEPYGVQPSPDYPAEIRSVKSKSDNLFDSDDALVTKVGFTKQSDGSYYLVTPKSVSNIWENTGNYAGRMSLAGECKFDNDSNGRGLILKINYTDGTSKDFMTDVPLFNRQWGKFEVITEEGKIVQSISCAFGNNRETYYRNIMLNKGDKALPYQPYGYVPVEAKVEGKNLFDKDNLTADYRLASDGLPFHAINYSLSDFIPVKPNTFYYRNLEITQPEAVAFYDENKTFIVRLESGRSFKTYANCRYIRTSALTSNVGTLQLEEGTAATPYEPYKLTTVQLPLGDIELRSTPDGTRDTFERVDGVWNYRADIIPFTITEDIISAVNNEYYSSPTARILKANIGASANYVDKICLMTSYKEGRKTAEFISGRFTTNASQTYLEVLDDRFTDLATAKTILSGETGIIKLATPTYTPITDPALIQALDELEELILHKGYNRITATSVNGVKAYLELNIPSTASVTNVIETESSQDLIVPLVSGKGDVKVKIPTENKMTLNPATGEVKVGDKELATKGYVDSQLANKQNKVTYSTTDLTAGTSTLATGDIYFVYE